MIYDQNKSLKILHHCMVTPDVWPGQTLLYKGGQKGDFFSKVRNRPKNGNINFYV